ESWQGSTYRVTGDWHETAYVSVPHEGKVAVVADGCGKFVQKEDASVHGVVDILLRDYVLQRPGLCVLDGAILVPNHDDQLFNAMVVQHKPDFAPLAIPSVVEVGGSIVVKGID